MNERDDPIPAFPCEGKGKLMETSVDGEWELLERLRPALEKRSRIIEAVRKHFCDRSFLEVETPVRIPSPAPELHIDAEPSGVHFLITSPELQMKRMLATGQYDRIFQICHCFRSGERGDPHRAPRLRGHRPVPHWRCVVPQVRGSRHRRAGANDLRPRRQTQTGAVGAYGRHARLLPPPARCRD